MASSAGFFHRHMLGESPAMSFMHYLGVGDNDKLARALQAATRTGRDGNVAGVSCDSIARSLDTDPA